MRAQARTSRPWWVRERWVRRRVAGCDTDLRIGRGTARENRPRSVVGDPGCSRNGGAHIRAGLLASARRLPEHRVATAGGGEHYLRTILPGPVEDQIDRCAPPDAGPHGHPLDDAGVVWPFDQRHRIAIQGLRSGPCPRRAEHHPLAQRQPQQVGQPRFWIRVMGYQQLHGLIIRRPASTAAAALRAATSTGSQTGENGGA